MFSKEFVALYEALVWITFWSVLIFVFRHKLKSITDAVIKQIQSGAPIRFGDMFSLGTPPKGLKEDGEESFVTSDKSADILLPEALTPELINTKYKELIEEQYFLLHAADVTRPRTGPKTGRYRVRVWLESYHDIPLNDVVKVTYRVWHGFKKPIFSTTSMETDFDMWLSVYGEFPILAYVERRGKDGVWLNRYIELPGRPPD